MRRIVAAAIAMAVASSATAWADTKAKMRVASEAEIREQMNERSKATSVSRNGYTYQSGNPVGYKVSNGEICLLFPNGQRDCANVETDGKTFEMITRDGDRSAF